MEQNRKPDKRERISTVLLAAGGLLVSIGFGMIDPSAGVTVAGVISIVYGLLIDRGGSQ